MKILVVCGAGRLFGKETVTLLLLAGLRNKGHDVRCVTTTWNEGTFEKQLQKYLIPHVSLPLGFISKTLSWSAMRMTLAQGIKLPTLWSGYRREIASFRPDIVLHSGFHHLVLLWPLLRGPVNVFHVHEAFAPTRFYRQIFKLLSKRIAMFVGVSRFVANSLGDLGVADDKIACVLNGVDVSGLSDLLREKERSVTLRIGIVGQIDEWKGHQDLVRALGILRGEGHAFICRIFGTGSAAFASKLRSSINAQKLTDKVEWMGFVEDKNSLYGNIDVCIVPSRFAEPFGMVAAEAAAHGLAVVASRVGGLSEVVLDGKTGYLVAAGAPEELAEKIGALMKSPDRRIEMGRNGRAHVVSKLSAITMTDKMDKLFHLSVVDKQALSRRRTSG